MQNGERLGLAVALAAHMPQICVLPFIGEDFVRHILVKLQPRKTMGSAPRRRSCGASRKRDGKNRETHFMRQAA